MSTQWVIAFGVLFPREFPEAAHEVLQHYGLAKSISNIPALLDSMASIRAAQLTLPNYESILKHLASRFGESISQGSIQSLRNLPIFPLLASTIDGSVVTSWTAIPQGHSMQAKVCPCVICWSQ